MINNAELLKELAELRLCGQKYWLQEKPKKKEAGRYPKTNLEKIRFKTWYWWMRERCPDSWTDEELSRELGMGKNNPRVIDRMRRTGLCPRTINSPGTGGSGQEHVGLAKRVASHPLFNGSDEVVISMFWTALGKKLNTLLSVRIALNDFLYSHHLLRLEGDLNELINDQLLEWVRNNESGVRISDSRVFYGFLELSLESIPSVFGRLTLIGLLIRESLITCNIENIDVLSIALDVVTNNAAPKYYGKSEAKKKQYSEFLIDFKVAIRDYIYRGHIDTHQESLIYLKTSLKSTHGYIINRQSGFIKTGALSESTMHDLIATDCDMERVTHLTRSGEWDTLPQSYWDNYFDESYQEWQSEKKETE